MTTGAPLFERGPPLSEIQNSSIFALDDISDEEMNNLIDGTVTDFDDGDLVNGNVVKIERDEVLLDIGYKAEGGIPSRELSIRKDVNPADVVAMNDEIESLVLQKEDKEGRLVLSKKRAEYEPDLNAVEEKFNSGETVEGEVIEGVKVGQEVEVQVLDVDLNRERISLGLKQTTEDPWRTLVKKYPVDAIVEGKVTKLVTFGAFVDLGDGVEGLVHISEMAKQHVDQPSQVCTVGDTVQVKVMEIDLDRRRISLSMKAAAETLGTEVEVKPLPESEKPAEAAEETVEE